MSAGYILPSVCLSFLIAGSHLASGAPEELRCSMNVHQDEHVMHPHARAALAHACSKAAQVQAEKCSVQLHAHWLD